MSALGQDAPRFVRVIDFETTGLPDDEGAEIVEIGCADLNLETLEIDRLYSSLVKPERPITPRTMAVHHITNDDVANAPVLDDVIGRLTAGLSQNDLYCAHNVKMERHFFDGDGRGWVCTHKVCATLWPDFESHSNQTCRYELGLEIDRTQAEPPHRALPDAYVTAAILRRCLQERTVSELAEITRRPILLKTIRFGKHRGKTFEELARAERGYLEWMARQDMDEDVAYTVKHWLGAA